MEDGVNGVRNSVKFGSGDVANEALALDNKTIKCVSRDLLLSLTYYICRECPSPPTAPSPFRPLAFLALLSVCLCLYEWPLSPLPHRNPFLASHSPVSGERPASGTANECSEGRMGGCIEGIRNDRRSQQQTPWREEVLAPPSRVCPIRPPFLTRRSHLRASLTPHLPPRNHVSPPQGLLHRVNAMDAAREKLGRVVDPLGVKVKYVATLQHLVVAALGGLGGGGGGRKGRGRGEAEGLQASEARGKRIDIYGVRNSIGVGGGDITKKVPVLNTTQ